MRKTVKTFVDYFGKESFVVINAIIEGIPNQVIEKEFNVPKTSIAAYRANVTRGTYYPFVEL